MLLMISVIPGQRESPSNLRIEGRRRSSLRFPFHPSLHLSTALNNKSAFSNACHSLCSLCKDMTIHIKFKFSDAGICFGLGSAQSDAWCTTAMVVFLNQKWSEHSPWSSGKLVLKKKDDHDNHLSTKTYIVPLEAEVELATERQGYVMSLWNKNVCNLIKWSNWTICMKIRNEKNNVLNVK